VEIITFDDLEYRVQPGWRVQDIIPESSFTLLYAERGIGKSFLTLDWALCTLMGKQWHGHEVKFGEVLYIIAEGEKRMWPRVQAWKSYYQYNHGVGGRVIPEAVQFHRPANVTALLSELEDRDEIINLVIIDTVHRCFSGGDEDKAQDMGMWIEGVNRLQRQTDADVIAVHHAGWNASHERGSTALGAAADTILRFRKGMGNDELVLSCEKQKDSEEFPDIRLHLTKHADSCILTSVDTPAPPEMRTLAVLVKMGGHATRDAWLAESRLPQSTWYRHVEVLRKQGKISEAGENFVTSTHVRI